MEEDFHVLPGGVKDLEDARLGQNLEERAEIDPWRQGIDSMRLLGVGDLNQAELRPIGPLPHEFGVDGDVGGIRETLAEISQRRQIGNAEFITSHYNARTRGRKRTRKAVQSQDFLTASAAP